MPVTVGPRQRRYPAHFASAPEFGSRPPNEVAGHIPGAKHIFLPELAERRGELDASRPVAVHCASGYRASLAASILQKEGVQNVANIPGSWLAWQKAGYPVEK